MFHWIVEECRLVTGSRDDTVRVWDVRTGECRHTLKGHTSWVDCIAFDGTTIVSGSWDKTVRIWRAPYNTTEGVMKCEGVIEGHMLSVSRVWLCTASNEHIVVSVDRGNKVHVHDMRTGNQVCAPIECAYCKLS